MAELFVDGAPTVHFLVDDLRDARERSKLSLIARIFWEEPRELRLVENAFIPVWKCDRISSICYLYDFLSQFMFDCPSLDLVYDELVHGSWMHLKVNPKEEEGQSPLLLHPPTDQSQAGRGRGGLHPSVTVRLSSTLHRQWARGGRLDGARNRGGVNADVPQPLLAFLGLTDFYQQRPCVCPLRSVSPSPGAADGSSRASGLAAGIGGPLQASSESASSSVPSSATVGRQVGPSNHAHTNL
ncbi:hypothetical protein LINPERPRIM_LOCUS771 [Linum perenne]